MRCRVCPEDRMIEEKAGERVQDTELWSGEHL